MPIPRLPRPCPACGSAADAADMVDEDRCALCPTTSRRAVRAAYLDTVRREERTERTGRR